MANGTTSNFQLNQWAASDPVLMADFNADNQKIDTALTALDDRAKIVFGSYVGTGEHGSAHPITLDFTDSLGRPPKFVLVASQYGNQFLLLFQGVTFVSLNTPEFGSSYSNYITWSGNSVSYYCTNSASGQLNAKDGPNPGVVYYYMAIG